MPRRIENAKIALINEALEIKKTEFEAKLNISNPNQIKSFMEEENHLLKEMVNKIKSAGSNVVLCQKGIDDIIQHYLSKDGILAVRRIKESDMTKLSKATGGRIVGRVDDLNSTDLGLAENVEEKRVEEDNWVFIEGCKNPKAISILLRGGTQRVIDEADRSIHDALMVVKDVIEKPKIVYGGGAPGVDVINGTVADFEKLGIIEPVKVKEQVIKSATETANMILRIDNIVASSRGSAMPPQEGMPGIDME